MLFVIYMHTYVICYMLALNHNIASTTRKENKNGIYVEYMMNKVSK